VTAVNPIPAVRGIGPVQIGLSAAGITVAALWALWPMGTPAVHVPVAAETPAPEWEPGELRIAAFSAPLWVAPPAPLPPPTPERRAPPPPPLKIQLLAVVNKDGVYEAILFDPDADRLYTLREGESLGERTVERVSPAGVDLRELSGLRTLALQERKP
jgi:hypothetical protein